jgi:hypothetical protein
LSGNQQQTLGHSFHPDHRPPRGLTVFRERAVRVPGRGRRGNARAGGGLSMRDTPSKATLPLYELRHRCDARPV